MLPRRACAVVGIRHAVATMFSFVHLAVRWASPGARWPLSNKYCAVRCACASLPDRVWRMALVARCGAVCRGKACSGVPYHKSGVRTRPIRFPCAGVDAARPACGSLSFVSTSWASGRGHAEVAPEQPDERYGRGFRYLLPVATGQASRKIRARSASCMTLLQRRGHGPRF